MSARAKARQAADTERVEAERHAHDFRVVLEPNPPLIAEPQHGWMSKHPGHEGHVGHLHGTAVMCSCRELHGITTVVFPDDYVPPTWCGFCDESLAPDDDD